MTIRSLQWKRMSTGSRKRLLPLTTAGTLTYHQGVIVTTSPLTVTLEDGVTACPAHLLDVPGYTPTVNDVVMVLDQGGILSVLTKWLS